MFDLCMVAAFIVAAVILAAVILYLIGEGAL